MQLILRQARRALLVSAITLICGFSGILFYLLSENRTSLRFSERLLAYVLAWPLIQLEHLAGVEDFIGRETRAHHWILWSAWIALWIYYFVLLAFWQRRRRFRNSEAR